MTKASFSGMLIQQERKADPPQIYYLGSDSYPKSARFQIV